MKRMSILLLSIIMVFTVMGTASAAPKEAAVNVVMDGYQVDLGSNAVMINGKVYVEFRTVLNRLGYKAEYRKVSRTIIANAEGVKLKASVGNPMAYVNDKAVASKDAVMIYKGKVWLGLRFIAGLSNYTVGWNSKLQTITLTSNGPVPQQIVNLYRVIENLASAQEKGNISEVKGLLTADTVVDVKGLEDQISNASIKTVFKEKRVESFTDTAAEVFVIEEAVRVGGGFFPSTKSQVRYSLHSNQTGVWKIYDRNVLTQEYTDLTGAFDQAVTVPDSDKTAIGDIFAVQVKASNEENLDAYMATLVDSGNVTVRKSIDTLFKSTNRTNMIEKWAIVESKGDKAKIYVSLITDTEINGTKTSTRTYLVIDVVKIGGKWLLSPETSNLYMESV